MFAIISGGQAGVDRAALDVVLQRAGVFPPEAQPGTSNVLSIRGIDNHSEKWSQVSTTSVHNSCTGLADIHRNEHGVPAGLALRWELLPSRIAVPQEKESFSWRA